MLIAYDIKTVVATYLPTSLQQKAFDLLKVSSSQ